MKKILSATVFMLAIMSTTFAQMDQHITWKFSTQDLGDNKVEIICEASLDEGWHVYSTDLPENTAIPTNIEIEESKDYKVIDGITEEPEASVHFDETFNAELKWFEGHAVFKKVVELSQQGDGVIK